MVVSNNIPALFTHLSMRRADRGLSSAMMRLSTGVRINSAREDAAGMAIANKLNNQVGGLNQASENATHGISLIQTAEGALNEVHNMLQRMRELAVQSANDSNTERDRGMIQMEVEELIAEIHAIASNTEFNRMRILNGEADRVLESMLDGVITRSHVTPIFISPAVQPGELFYDIVEVGRHAVMAIDIPTAGNPPAGNLIINGVAVTVQAGDTWGDFEYNLNSALTHAGISMQTGTGDTFLVSNIAGRDQHITIEGNAGLMNALFGTAGPVSERGSDARIAFRPDTDTGSIMHDVNGNPVAGADALAWSSRGNQVFIRGANGEDIRLNIQVAFQAGRDASLGPPPVTALSPGHVFGDRNTLAPTDENALAEVEMTLAVRSFGPIMLQIGPSHNQAMPVQIPRISAETLGLVEFVGGIQRLMVNYRTVEGAVAALPVMDRAITTTSLVRSRLGSYQNRLESTVRSLDIAAENTETSRSRIQDADIARESTRFAQYNVMFQAAMAILGQANQRPMQMIGLLQ